MARTPALPEASPVGALSAQLRAAAICYVRLTSIGDIRSVAMNVCSGSETGPKIVISRPPYLLPRRW
jgi:hypothetical protein